MDSQAKILILGGGIWGLSTAYHLARTGETNVQLLERNQEPCAETTSQAAGLVGQIRSTLLMRRAIRYAIDFFTAFEEQTGYDPGFRQVGSLLLALTHERMLSYVEHVEHATKNGVEAHFVDQGEMVRLAPHLDPSSVEGGYFVPGDGYVDPMQCAKALGAAAEDLGAKVRTGMRVTNISVRDDRAVDVETDSGFFEAEKVVITAGPWTGLLAKTVGYEPAMVPIRHQRITTGYAPGIPDHHPVVRLTDLSCYLRPEYGGYLHGIFEPEPVVYDLEESPPYARTRDVECSVRTMAQAHERLAAIFPILENLPIVECKRGLTTFAPDGAYLVGPVPQVENLFLATGCASLGIAGSAAVGRWLANWVTQGEPGEDLSAVDPERFGEKGRDRDWIWKESRNFYANYYSIPSMAVT
jgi:4-methylaminobutanoate oxidase (formaldehyde-forming)